MRIQEIETLTGLTRKSIRYYEDKGLIRVCRSGNSYREYDDETLTRLRLIAALRQAGISIATLQLWTDGVISAAELLQGRIGELRDAAASNSGQRELCEQMLAGLKNDDFPPDVYAAAIAPRDETVESPIPTGGTLCLGIDIGTTTLSAALIDITHRRQLESYTLANDSTMPGKPYEHMQNARRITERVTRLIDALSARYPHIRAIGVTSQMHGIVYTDADGAILSPLYTWQDARASLPFGDSTYAEVLGISAGYGLATHFYNVQNQLVPAGAHRFSSIGDLIAMKLSGNSEPMVHPSMAASFGLFDTAAGRFTDKAEPFADLLPAVVGDGIIGDYHGIPIAAAIGDNQASFFGAVCEPCRSVLANFGSGSQISMATSLMTDISGSLELRPYVAGAQLFCGSALCGGRAYAMLERFFGAFMSASGMGGSHYETLNRLAMENLDRPLHVRTTFCGTRDEPSMRGLIDGIGEDSFTPGALAAGILRGMAEELHGMLFEMDKRRPETTPIDRLVASGNAVRKNPALRETLTRVFGMKPAIPCHTEEAAFGAALYAAKCAGLADDAALRECIRYEQEDEI